MGAHCASAVCVVLRFASHRWPLRCVHPMSHHPFSQWVIMPRLEACLPRLNCTSRSLMVCRSWMAAPTASHRQRCVAVQEVRSGRVEARVRGASGGAAGGVRLRRPPALPRRAGRLLVSPPPPPPPPPGPPGPLRPAPAALPATRPCFPPCGPLCRRTEGAPCRVPRHRTSCCLASARIAHLGGAYELGQWAAVHNHAVLQGQCLSRRLT